MKIENWKIISLKNNKDYQILGNVWGRPNTRNGEWLRTSNIKILDISNNLVITLNSTYELGKHAEGTVRMGEER
jgi:hypothetical protein